MPGNTLRFASAPLEPGKLLFARFGGFGVLGSELPTSGEQGPSFLLDDLDAGDDSTEIRPRITAVPSAGTFSADEFGAFALLGAPVGTYTFRYRPIVGVTELGEATETIAIGGATPVAFAAALPALGWAGSAQLGLTGAAFAAVLPALTWTTGPAAPAAHPDAPVVNSYEAMHGKWDRRYVIPNSARTDAAQQWLRQPFKGN